MGRTVPFCVENFHEAQEKKGFASYRSIITKIDSMRIHGLIDENHIVTRDDIKNACKLTRQRIDRTVLDSIARAMDVSPQYLTGELKIKNIEDLHLYTDIRDSEGYLIPSYYELEASQENDNYNQMIESIGAMLLHFYNYRYSHGSIPHNGIGKARHEKIRDINELDLKECISLLSKLGIIEQTQNQTDGLPVCLQEIADKRNVESEDNHAEESK